MMTTIIASTLTKHYLGEFPHFRKNFIDKATPMLQNWVRNHDEMENKTREEKNVVASEVHLFVLFAKISNVD